MSITTLGIIRITVGLGVLVYVGICFLNQKVWIRKSFSWGTREEYPKIFILNVIGGTLIGIGMITSSFFF